MILATFNKCHNQDKTFKFVTYTCIISLLIPIDFRHGWAISGFLMAKNTWKGGSMVRLVGLPDSFLNVSRYQLDSWYIDSVGCTTHWDHISLDPFHVLSLGRGWTKHSLILETVSDYSCLIIYRIHHSRCYVRTWPIARAVFADSYCLNTLRDKRDVNVWSMDFIQES